MKSTSTATKRSGASQCVDGHPYPPRHRAGRKRGHSPLSTRIEAQVSCSFPVSYCAGGPRFPDAAGLNLMGGTDTLRTWQAIHEYVPLTTRGGACEGFAKGIASADWRSLARSPAAKGLPLVTWTCW